MLRKVLPHVCIVLCNMYIVFFLLDRVNSAMQFIDNGITKALLLVLCVISTVNASFLILDERRKRELLNRKRAAARREALQRRASQGAAAPQAAHQSSAAARESARTE